ncbi:MAG: acyltransferase [Planctomycetota bacterium]
MPISPDAFVHERAMVDEPCDIGAGTRVWANAHVLKTARIGAHCNIGEGCFIEGGVSIGDHCTIKNGVAVWSGVTLSNYVFLGPHVVLTNDMRPRSHPDFRTAATDWLPTPIGEGASIGANATIVCGNSIGAWSMIAAGAVVSHDVPPHALVAGVPARRIAWICRCGETLKGAAAPTHTHVCGKCARRYKPLDAEPAAGLQLVEP